MFPTPNDTTLKGAGNVGRSSDPVTSTPGPRVAPPDMRFHLEDAEKQHEHMGVPSAIVAGQAAVPVAPYNVGTGTPASSMPVSDMPKAGHR